MSKKPKNAVSSNPNKEWLDKNVVPLLKGTALSIYSFLWNGSPPSEYLVWLNSPEKSPLWGRDTKKLIVEDGFRFDYVREPQAVALDGGKITIFGGDGTPFIDEKGMVSVRLFKKMEDGKNLILQVSCLLAPAESGATIRGFYELFDMNPVEVTSTYGTQWGQA